MDSWHSYSKVYNLGHRATQELFKETVVVEEKIDGSQFSFGIFDGEIKVKSKNREFDVHGPDNMFKLACETVLSLADKLLPGWTYRAEYLQKPKHNCLTYGRIPKGHLILFDIGTGDNRYLDYEAKAAEAERLGLEVVPLLKFGLIETPRDLLKLLERKSILGEERIEGFVIKNYSRFGIDGKVLMGKHVSEGFKERHRVTFRQENPQQGDLLIRLQKAYRTEARWHKAYQHLRDDGKLTNTPSDIGELIKEVHNDIDAECADEIKEILYKWAGKKIKQSAARGVAEWYKHLLLEQSFGEGIDV